MRFTSSSAILILFFAFFGFAIASQRLDRDNIEDELARSYLMRRDDTASTDSTATSTSGRGHSASSSANSDAASASSTATSSDHGKSSTASSSEAASTTTATTNKKKSSAFDSPDILQSGTLFYIGISITTLLWCTGKAIDVQTNRQERYAESLVHSI